MEKEMEKLVLVSQKVYFLVFCVILDKEFRNLLMYLGQMQKVDEIDKQMQQMLTATMSASDFDKLEKESSELLSNLKKQSWLEDCPNTKFICETVWSFHKDDDTKRILNKIAAKQNTIFARLEGLRRCKSTFKRYCFR